MEKNVTVIETKYQKVSSNLNHCRKSLKSLEGILRRLGSDTSTASSSSSSSSTSPSNSSGAEPSVPVSSPSQSDSGRSGTDGWMEADELARSHDDDFLDTLNIKV